MLPTFKLIVDVAFGLGMFINALLFVPQAIKLWRTKDAVGVSLLTFGGFNLIQILAVLHAYFVKDYILLLGFTASFFTCGAVTVLALFYKLRYPNTNSIPKTETPTTTMNS